MSKGYGELQRTIIRRLPELVRPGTLTQPGQQPREVRAIIVNDLCQAIFGTKYTISNNVSLRRSLKNLTKAGEVKLFYITSPGKRGSRTTLVVEWLDLKNPPN